MIPLERNAGSMGDVTVAGGDRLAASKLDAETMCTC